MNYNFFADKSDKIKVLEFIFQETDLQIYDSYSPLGEEICEYKSAEEIVAKFELDIGGKFAQTFQMWSPRHKIQPVFQKIKLKPRYNQGHEFRYHTVGFGLIQLYFGGIEKSNLNSSHIGHFNEKGALKHAESAKDWNWREIRSTSNKLKYQIHKKMVVKKNGSQGILAGAEILIKKGIKLV